MTRHMTVGATDHDGVRWMRCPTCGDSGKSSTKAHMMVDTKGATHCFKCGTSTQLPIGDLIEIALGMKSVDEAVEGFELEDRGAKEQRRFSLLETYADDEVDAADAFEMRDQHGRRVGWHVRYPRKAFKNEGDRGVGYVGQYLVSKPFDPLIVVEGPYDVVKPRYACTFGTMNAGNLRKFFSMQFVWLFPDPDQVDTPMKRRRFAERVVAPALDAFVFVQGVILAPGDPDEVRDDQMSWLSTEEVMDLWAGGDEDPGTIHRLLSMA